MAFPIAKGFLPPPMQGLLSPTSLPGSYRSDRTRYCTDHINKGTEEMRRKNALNIVIKI